MSAAWLALLLLAATPPDPAAVRRCRSSVDLRIFTSPAVPHARAPLRIIVAAEQDPGDVALAVRGPDGVVQQLEVQRYGGPPFGLVAEVPAPAPGPWRIALGDGEAVQACRKVHVRRRRPKPAEIDPERDPVWRARWKWERDTENFYSVWIEHLFRAPPDAEPTWRPLHVVLRDPARNLLYDHRGLDADGPGREALTLRPDCADLPYTLRAYFAFKLGLPMGYRACRRGTARRAPTCSDELRTQDEPAAKDSLRDAFQRFARRRIAGYVHSSSGRTAPGDEDSDWYPVELTRRALRPGTAFHDPYGHVLVISRWEPQAEGRPGVLFAVDAQPDATVGRRRFWRGSFLFPEPDGVAGAGFKRFRPVVYQHKLDHCHKGALDRRPAEPAEPSAGGAPIVLGGPAPGAAGATTPPPEEREPCFEVLGDRQIVRSADWGDLSVQQRRMSKEQFYERMDELINPSPLPPEVALGAQLDALTEQVRRRVLSVDAGEQHLAAHPAAVIPMPEGAAIFQTSGPWEDYSTPARDLRLLIAIDSVVGFAERIRRRPERFRLAPDEVPEAAAGRVAKLVHAQAATRTLTYTRSDGHPQQLTVADVIDRRVALEMAYNPNDCPELRWGAPEGSAELQTCKRRAPEEQRARMETYRPWFQRRRRPLE